MSTFAVRLFGDPVLRQRASEVEELDGDLARLASTMIDTMYEAIGLGLAAPQVGVLKRMFVYDLGDGPQVLINPQIVDVVGGVDLRRGLPLAAGPAVRDRAPEAGDRHGASTSTGTRSSSRATS